MAIVDVNDFPPAFLEPWTPQNPFLSISVPEEQPKGTIVHTFRATDNDSNIDRFRILNPSKNKRPFEIDADTGNFHHEKISIFYRQSHLLFFYQNFKWKSSSIYKQVLKASAFIHKKCLYLTFRGADSLLNPGGLAVVLGA